MSNGRFPLPASTLVTVRNSLFKTAAISYWIPTHESPRRTSPSPGRVRDSFAIQLRELRDCGGTRGAHDTLRKATNSHGRVIYIRNLYARRFPFSLSLREKKARFTVIELEMRTNAANAYVLRTRTLTINTWPRLETYCTQARTVLIKNITSLFFQLNFFHESAFFPFHVGIREKEKR